jgi:hemerythrin-like domain-containing protein
MRVIQGHPDHRNVWIDPKLTFNIMGVVSDPIQELAHDHRELSGLLLAVRDALVRVESGHSKLDDEVHEIRDGTEVFREALLEHFAREQEGLLPFVVARLPAVSRRVDELIAEHDRIADVLTVLVKELDAIEKGGKVGSFRAALTRFEDLYAAHSKAELGFLTEVADSLADDTAATNHLRSLLDEP